MLTNELQSCTDDETRRVLDRARDHSNDILIRSAATIGDYVTSTGLDPGALCFVAVGSMGRREALAASDLDLLPIMRTNDTLNAYKTHDSGIRERLRGSLGIPVSRGEDLTAPDAVGNFAASEAIGGALDSSAMLTRRIEILTEGAEITSWGFGIDGIRRQILNAYAEAERTSGRHVLSLCNDLARFYRTLHIEYKAKVDVENKDWCTRNMRLRHSRKLWLFSCIMAIVELASRNPDGEQEYVDGLLKAFSMPPTERLVYAAGERHRSQVGRILRRYAWFLQYMSEGSHREALAAVEYGGRNAATTANPFPALKLNSDLLHREIMALVEDLEGFKREKVLDWFLL
ncbi:hypothetical protein HY634_01265 [Candidatus Uhrbacteria bacterium]|nr:hypothetical protein [Candidatus Uhrbacteria bacterium]